MTSTNPSLLRCAVRPATSLPASAVRWAGAMLQLDPRAGATLSSLLTPGRQLHQALAAAGLNPTLGRVYQPTPADRTARNTVRGLPFIPMVMYAVTGVQLARLSKSFQLDTRNALSSALGQTQNRGAVSTESYTPGTRTLWRMAVYGRPGKPGALQVGFYGEALPTWARGQGFVVVGGKTLPLRVGLDTRVGTAEGALAKAWDAAVLRLGLSTR